MADTKLTQHEIQEKLAKAVAGLSEYFSDDCILTEDEPRPDQFFEFNLQVNLEDCEEEFMSFHKEAQEALDALMTLVQAGDNAPLLKAMVLAALHASHNTASILNEQFIFTPSNRGLTVSSNQPLQ